MSPESLIEQYGYAALILGTILEGETPLVMAGFAARRGYLDLSWVIAAACAGSLAGDQFYFLLGRFRGPAFLVRRPAWKARLDRAYALSERYRDLLVVGFRFLYGLRMATPMAFGAQGMNPLRFTLLNTLGALIWSVFFALLGYYFGDMLELILGDLRRVEMSVLGAIGVAGFAIWLVRQGRKERKRKAGPGSP
jgi:membrane protein DedA with SNARE-associated domain